MRTVSATTIPIRAAACNWQGHVRIGQDQAVALTSVPEPMHGPDDRLADRVGEDLRDLHSSALQLL